MMAKNHKVRTSMIQCSDLIVNETYFSVLKLEPEGLAKHMIKNGLSLKREENEIRQTFGAQKRLRSGGKFGIDFLAC